MNYEQEQQFAAEVKRYVTEHLPLSQISDSELQQQIEDIVEQRIGAGTAPSSSGSPSWSRCIAPSVALATGLHHQG